MDENLGAGREGLWDTVDVANFLKLKPFTVRKMVRQGRLPSIRIGRLIRFVPEVIRQKYKR